MVTELHGALDKMIIYLLPILISSTISIPSPRTRKYSCLQFNHSPDHMTVTCESSTGSSNILCWYHIKEDLYLTCKIYLFTSWGAAIFVRGGKNFDVSLCLARKIFGAPPPPCRRRKFFSKIILAGNYYFIKCPM